MPTEKEIEERGLGAFATKTISLKGLVDPKLLQEFKDEMESLDWCECKDSSGAYYVDDTKEMKHHWCCEDCNKIVQIG